MIINVSDNTSEKDMELFFKDINYLREKIFVPITLGGGIRNLEDAKNILKMELIKY